MTNHSKNKINWYYCLVGLFALFLYFFSHDTQIQEMDLETKKIVLFKNIEFIKRHQNLFLFSDAYLEASLGVAFVKKIEGYSQLAAIEFYEIY